MTKQEDKLFGAKIIGVASAVRRTVLLGKQRIADAVEASPFDEHELESLIEFANLLMRGYDKQDIIDRVQISPELEVKLGKLGIYDW